MQNYQIVQLVEGFREGWVDAAIKRDSVEAAKHIININSKIELLLTLWNWSDESVDYPLPR